MTIPLILWVHNEAFSTQDVVINHELTNFKVGDLLEISSTNAKKLVVQVSQFDQELVSKHSNLQISIAQHIATIFDLIARSEVSVKIIDKTSLIADYIVFSFKDQYVGRSHMWSLKNSVSNTCVYNGKRFSELGIRANIKDIVVKGVSVPCAFITPATRTIFRSASAKFFIFIQMSREMFSFEEDGELFYEKCVYGFLPELFRQWKTNGCNHIVSIVLFGRVIYKNSCKSELKHTLSMDSFGRYYRDFYRVVIDWENMSDWDSVLTPIRRELMRFQKDVLETQVIFK